MKTPLNLLGSRLRQLLGLALMVSLWTTTLTARADLSPAEKPDLRLGFIKLTDMAPLAVAWEQGFFMDEGLFVELEAQANWKVLLDRVITGELDGAHMLAGQPLGASIGYGTQADIITAFSMDLNGNGITVANDVWDIMRPHLGQADGKPAHPISASALVPVVEHYRERGEPFRMGMVFPVSTHNYELRYWLAAGGLNPGFYAPQRGDTSGTLQADVHLSVTPPPQMPATMEAGTIQGYCVGEPWNQQAVFKGIGVPVITDYEIWPNNPEKVFGVTRQWAEANPNTHLRLLRALIRAAHWLDQNNNANREQAVAILARPSYVGADAEVIANSMTGTFEYQKGDVREVPDFNVFFRYHATYPYPSDAIWYLSQMRRWGQIPEARPDSWYLATAARVYRGDIYQQAAQSLIRDGILAASDFPDFTAENFERPHQGGLIDGVPFTPRTPNAYIDSFAIGLKGSATP
ncbi:MAG: ABC transporter substrate-binding protein [Marinobacter sp.]|uniref:Nitrate ABC transporter substrate-binding protein n=2 Tax=Marinobacteraceae TaxID=2887365 RepID=A0A2G1ULC5_9GAMM|nr:ABC transporter substrate-binding protein [Marinobacter sp.]PHQ15304.1 nitrate ABC transporter substrate-binding protein [Marinobacter profundi]